MRITHEMERTPISFDDATIIREKSEDVAASIRILQLDEIIYRCFYVYKTLNLCSNAYTIFDFIRYITYIVRLCSVLCP